MLGKIFLQFAILIVLLDIFFHLFKYVFNRSIFFGRFSKPKPSSLFIISIYFAFNIWLYILFQQENTSLQFERLSLISKYFTFFTVLFCIYFIIDVSPKRSSKESGYYWSLVYGVLFAYLVPLGAVYYLLLNTLAWNAVTHIYLSLFAILLCLCELKFVYKKNLIEVFKFLGTDREDF